MPSHTIPSVSRDYASRSSLSQPDATLTASPGNSGSVFSSLVQTPLTWFACGLTALVGPRARRGITGPQRPGTTTGSETDYHVQANPVFCRPMAVVDTQPGHTIVAAPVPNAPTFTAPPPAITIDTPSPPRAPFPHHPSTSPPYDLTTPPPQPYLSPPIPTSPNRPLPARAPAPASKSSSRWTSLARVFQSLAAIRLSSASPPRPSSRLAIPTHFRGRRSTSRRSNSLHRSPTSSSFSHGSFMSSSAGTPPPSTPPVKPHAMLLPDSPLDREYAQWCVARDARAWIVVALAEIGLDPHAPVGVTTAAGANGENAMGGSWGRGPPASPVSAQSFQSGVRAGGGAAATTITEGLVQCVVQGGVDVDVASAMAAPVDALRALVSALGSLLMDDGGAHARFEHHTPNGFIGHDSLGPNINADTCDLSELAVVALKEVYHALKALRSPPPLYSELDGYPA